MNIVVNNTVIALDQVAKMNLFKKNQFSEIGIQFIYLDNTSIYVTEERRSPKKSTDIDLQYINWEKLYKSIHNEWYDRYGCFIKEFKLQ